MGLKVAKSVTKEEGVLMSSGMIFAAYLEHTEMNLTSQNMVRSVGVTGDQ